MGKFLYYKDKYAEGGTTAIVAVEKSTGEDYADVSVNLIGYGMKPRNENHIFVPSYNFTKETLETFISDLGKKVVREIPIGYGQGIELELKDNWKEICQDYKDLL